MALQKDYVFHGVTISGAYFFVQSLQASRPRDDTTIMVAVRQSDTVKEVLESKLYFLPYDNAMTVAKAYAHLKTLPEFAGAVDV